MSKNFVLIGAAGYVAPRHMKAIKEVGGNLIAAYDPHDSVGILDSYFPECRFFTEFERLDRFCYGRNIDYVSICSPNYLHDSQSRWALRLGADAICEKPLCTHAHNIGPLLDLEAKTGKRVWCILQARLHPAAIEAKEKYGDCEVEIDVDYIAPRGSWYLYSWKGDVSKSGGLATNIGVHLFDLVTWISGKHKKVMLMHSREDEAYGYIKTERGRCSWMLSVDMNKKQQRVFTINGESIDITSGFADLHNESYRKIMAGNGFGILDAQEAIHITEEIRIACK